MKIEEAKKIQERGTIWLHEGQSKKREDLRQPRTIPPQKQS